MLGSIKYNLSHLLDFTGRDARQTFWYYVLFLFVVQIGIGMAIMIPAMAGMMQTAMQAARSGETDQAVIQAQMAGVMSGAMGRMMWLSVSMNGLVVLLLLAAFVRRLHDSGKSGWWALLVVAGQALGIYLGVRMMEQMQAFMAEAFTPEHMPDLMQRQVEMSRYALIGWIAPITVIVFGVMKSTDGPNRFGDAPVSF